MTTKKNAPKGRGAEVIPWPGKLAAHCKSYCADCPARPTGWTLREVNWLRQWRHDCDSFEVRRALFAACAELGVNP